MVRRACHFLFLVAFLHCAVAEKIEFENCGGNVKSVDVTPCPTQPCEIPRGSSVIITVHCVSNVDSEKLRLSVWADLAGIEVPYPGMKRDACRGKNITCPLSNEQEFVYVQKFETKRFFPTVTTKAKFDLKTNDDQDKQVCCFRTPVKVIEKAPIPPQ